jgi:hypothetical protein
VVISDSLRSVGKALAQARQAKLKPDGKSMTQKDLATAVNAKPQDVSETRPEYLAQALKSCDDGIPGRR